ncbi:unnamed protein product, partial [Mesorhabditis spiculigera]
MVVAHRRRCSDRRKLGLIASRRPHQRDTIIGEWIQRLPAREVEDSLGHHPAVAACVQYSVSPILIGEKAVTAASRTEGGMVGHAEEQLVAHVNHYKGSIWAQGNFNCGSVAALSLLWEGRQKALRALRRH